MEDDPLLLNTAVSSAVSPKGGGHLCLCALTLSITYSLADVASSGNFRRHGSESSSRAKLGGGDSAQLAALPQVLPPRLYLIVCLLSLSCRRFKKLLMLTLVAADLRVGEGKAR